MSVRRRFLSPFWLIVTLPMYIGWRLIPPLTSGPIETALGLILFCCFCGLVLTSSMTRSMRNQEWADRLAWIASIAMGFFSSLFVLTLLRDVVLLGAQFWPATRHSTSLAEATARWALGLTFAVTLVGFVIARRRPSIVEIQIPVDGLPQALRGFSIAQISDIHVGPTIKQGFVQRIVDRVNSLNADLIAVTGDLVDGSVARLSAHTAPLRGLTARHGAFFVTGNHEYYSGEPAWTREIGRLGIRVLKNEHVVLNHDGASVVVAGVTDYTAHHFDAAQQSDPEKALRGAPSGAGARILLAHQPSSADAASSAGFDVQLSGHTHGGQFWPWNLFVHFFQPFTGGLHRLKKLWVYVNRGTGYWGPPNRFGVPSEITYIRLVPGEVNLEAYRAA
jgi:uncharacterized protein